MTIWMLTAGIVVMVVAAAFAMAAAATVTRHRARNAADLAALAAAAQAWEGEQAACATAEELSRRNGAILRSCRLVGLDVLVTVEVRLSALAGAAQASARAGPVSRPADGP
jgi:secretion/DNA translocation related TadE-like protein